MIFEPWCQLPRGGSSAARGYRSQRICSLGSAAAVERGVVLILAIFAVVLLSVLAVGISAAVRVELRASQAGMERLQGLFLAEAGLRQARAILLYDDQKLDTLRDAWGAEADSPLDWPHQFGNGSYRVRVEDASGRINVNTADLDTLSRVVGSLQVAEAIIAWRQPIAGADDAYYASLAAPYQPRHGPFQSLGELLLVRGVTPDMFFGGDGSPGLADLLTVEAISPNTDADGNIRIGLNEFRNWGEFEAFQRMVMGRLGSVLTMYDAEQIYNGWSTLVLNGQPGYNSLAQLITVAGLGYDKIINIVDHFTMRPGIAVTDLVNINTAPPEVIAALPGGSISLGSAIAARRSQAPFKSLGDFTEFLLNQPNGPDVFALMIDHVNVKSSIFIVEAMGYPPIERGFRTLRALVRRSQDQVIMVHQVEDERPLPAST